MQRCCELAEKGRGSTGINPMVGAVLVRDGSVIAEGWHQLFGEDHAERELIKKCEQDIQQDDALYVNLEPCAHEEKTPSCAQLIIDAGIRTVIYGMTDPNPKVAGKGISMLKAAGVTVIGPVDSVVCRRLNRGFVSLHEQGRPWITLKKAQTKDGSIAKDDGSRLCITSDEQNAWSHEHLRAKHDAILVGVQTIVSDDPQLTVRLSNKKVDQLNPLRIVLDPELRIPLNATVLTPDFAKNTLIITGEGTPIPDELSKKGVRIIAVPFSDVFDFPSVWKELMTPTDEFFGIKSILVEGGKKTWHIFEEAGLVDESIVLVGE